MRIPLEFYNHIRDTVRVSDIVRLRIILTKKGGEYLGICPFHTEKTPSFTVNDSKRFYHCFGCSAHGDVIKFVSETSGISYKEAAIKIAGENNIELPKMSAAQEEHYEETDQIYNILSLASQFFTSKLNDDVLKYLKKRGLSEEIIKNFEIGYAPGGGELERFFEKKSIPLKFLLKAGLVGKREDARIYEIFNKRIMFPIKNIYNKVVGFGGRALGDNMPKYINSPETLVFKKGETMYGENVATGYSYKHNYSIVVEGYMDVIALHQADFKQAVASLGTAVTEKHIQKLWRSGDEIIACLDGDQAGIRASNRLINMALPHIAPGKSISFMEMPAGKDPDDLLKDSGSKSFAKLIEQRLGLSEMIWKTEFSGRVFKTAEARATLEQKLQEQCALIQDKNLKANFGRYFKDMIWNNLIRKKSSKAKASMISEELNSVQEYSELEVLESALCSFLINFPEILLDSEFNIKLKDKDLNDFKDWVFDLAAHQSQLTSDLIEVEVKKTGFYDTFLVLSSPKVLFLDQAFLKKDGIDQEQVFEWLCKKHYLLLLKQEYIDVSSSLDTKAQSKSSSYLEEIQKISRELSQLSENLIND